MPGLFGDFFSNLFGDGGGGFGSMGSTGLSPDQAAMQQQQGFFYRPDAIQPNNAPWQQPTGYSGLTPDQIQAVQQQGFFTGGGLRPQSLWDKLADKLGQPGTADALKKIAGDLGDKPAQAGPPAAAMHAGIPGAAHPYFNIYRHLQLDPRAALKSLMGGNLV